MQKSLPAVWLWLPNGAEDCCCISQIVLQNYTKIVCGISSIAKCA